MDFSTQAVQSVFCVDNCPLCAEISRQDRGSAKKRPSVHNISIFPPSSIFLPFQVLWPSKRVVQLKQLRQLADETKVASETCSLRLRWRDRRARPQQTFREGNNREQQTKTFIKICLKKRTWPLSMLQRKRLGYSIGHSAFAAHCFSNSSLRHHARHIPSTSGWGT